MRRSGVLLFVTLVLWYPLNAQAPDFAQSYYHFSLAKMHELQRQFQEAISEFEKAVEHDPESSPLRVRFAEVLWKAGEVDRASGQAQRAVEIEPESAAPHFLLGQLHASYQTSAMMDKAIIELERAVELDPQHHRALFELGRLQFSSENFRASVDLFGRFLELRPWMAQAYWMKARAHVELAEVDEAVQTLKDSLEYDEDNVENLKFLGKLYEQTGKFDQAQALYSRLLDENSDPDTQYRLALLLSEQRKFAEAVAVLKDLSENFPRNLPIKIALGRAYRGQKKYALAADVFRDVLGIDPSHFRASYELAETLVQLGQREEALERFLKLLEVGESEQDRVSIQTNLGFIYQDMRQFEKAIGVFKTMLEENPEDDLASLRLVYVLKEADQLGEADDLSERLLKRYEAKTYEEAPAKNYFVVARAQILSAMDKLDDAIDLIKGEIDEFPEPVSFYLTASQLYLDHEKYQDAEKLLKEGLSSRADSERLQFQLGAMYERQGDVEQAEHVFERMLVNNPDHAGVLNYLGYMWADRGLHLQEALGYITKAVEMEPHNGAFLDSLGWVYFKLDQLGDAETKLAEAVRLNDSDPTIYEHLGDVYNKLGQYQKAQQYYQQSILFTTEEKEQAKVETKLTEVTERLSERRR